MVIVDDSEFTAASLANFLWVTFTRSNPAADVHGIGEFTANKHWGCTGSLVIDARTKPHHCAAIGRGSNGHTPRRCPGRAGRTTAWNRLNRNAECLMMNV